MFHRDLFYSKEKGILGGFQYEKGYWYVKDDGSYALSEWIADKGKWYYIAGDGYMVPFNILVLLGILESFLMFREQIFFVIRRTIMEAEVKDIIIQFKIIPVFRLLISRLALIGLGVNQIIIITLILFL